MAFAQDKKHDFFDNWSVQASLNHNLIRGDVLGLQAVGGTVSRLGREFEVEKEDKFDLGFGLRLAKQITPAFDLGFSVNLGQMTGTKRPAGNGNWEVKHSIIDFKQVELNGRVYFNRLSEHLGRQPKLPFFFEIGLGRVFAEIATGDNDDLTVVDRSTFEESKVESIENAWIASLGVGAEYKIADRIGLVLATKMFMTRTDDLDGVNGENFANQNDDFFVISNLGITYDLSRGNTGYKWHNHFKGQNDLALANTKAIEESESQLKALKGQISKLNSALAAQIAHNNNTSRPWKDADKDGVHDEDDKEAYTKRGSLVNFQGIAIKSNTATADLLFHPVFFDTDKYNVKERGFESIVEVALYMQKHTEGRIKLVGYADRRGSDTHNVELSRKRTMAVRKILTDRFGIDASRLEIDYKGENAAIADLLSVNRRVDFVVIN
ncbi:MAG: OmpA family protein [Flavobacteriales bacterium]